LPGKGKRALELGCGLGLVTNRRALRAGYDVLATDYYEDALLFARPQTGLSFDRPASLRHAARRLALVSRRPRHVFDLVIGVGCTL